VSDQAVNVPIELTSSFVVIDSVRLVARRLWVAVEFERRDGSRVLRDGLIDTGAPVSVIPFSIHRAQDLAWRQVSETGAPPASRWFDAECDFGYLDVWLPAPDARAAGPLMLLAKFPRETPRVFQKQRPPVPVLLGLNFFAALRADVHFQCYRDSDAGAIDIPAWLGPGDRD
jgi:hypothetical protein